MGRISEITRQTDAGTQEAAVSVSYLAELSEQLRSSVSTFRLPERNNEMLGSFPNMTSVSEMGDNSGEQMFSPAMLQNMDGDWGQNLAGNSFAGNFPPLPEPGNSGSLVALSGARSGSNQYAFSNQQQDFGGMGGFGSQQPFSGQANGGAQQGFSGGQQGFSGNPQYGGNGGNQQYGGNASNQQYGGNASNQQYGGNQQGFGSSEFDSGRGFGGQFGNQQNTGDSNGFDKQANFGGNGSQQFSEGASPFSFQNQPPFSNRNQPPVSNPNLLPPPGQSGQSAPVRPRWQQGGGVPNSQNFQNQQNQSQLLFNQDQTPFPNNG
jgi:hypothetical protein